MGEAPEDRSTLVPRGSRNSEDQEERQEGQELSETYREPASEPKSTPIGMVLAQLRARAQFLNRKKDKLPYDGAKERGDGFDRQRLDQAAAKRERKAQRPLNQFHR